MQHRHQIMLGLALSIILVGACVCPPGASAQDRPAVLWPTRAWTTSTAETQGMDSAALADLVASGTGYSLDSLLIARHGTIVLDAYYTLYQTARDPHPMYSATKAVIGTLTAIALKDGLLDSTSHRVLDFFHDRSIANVDDRKAAITVQDLLDMTSGIDWHEPLPGRSRSLFDMTRSPDWIKFILDRPMANAPGEVFNYDSGNPHLLSAILGQLSGMSAEDYAKAKLFGPLGIMTSPGDWEQDAQGISLGGLGLSLRPRDMAKIGYLYLRNGVWEGKAILPQAWIERISHATLSMNLARQPALRYANFFWVLPDKHVYMANGHHSQRIMVFPDMDIVAVTTGRDDGHLAQMVDNISAAVRSETALPPNPAAEDQLAISIRTAQAGH